MSHSNRLHLFWLVLSLALSACGGGGKSPPPNTPPSAVVGTTPVVNEGDRVVLDGSASSDPDGEIVSYAWSQTSGPSVLLNDAGKAIASFTAPATTTALQLSFRLTVTDNGGAVNSFDVSITVNPVNEAPAISAIDDQAIVEDASTGPLPFTLSDTDNPVAGLTVSVSSSNGQLVPPSGLLLSGSGANRSLTVTPAANQSGMATVTVTVSDGAAASTESFELAVAPVNDAPLAQADSASTTEDAAVTINVLANDSDVDGTLDPTTVTVTGAEQGAAVANPSTGAVSFTPASNFNGTAQFLYTVKDNEGGQSAPATVTIAVTAVNDRPLAQGLSVSGDEDQPLTGQLTATDADNDALTYAVTSNPSNGSLNLNSNGSFTYTPNAGFNGVDSFSYTARDAALTSDPATVTLTVKAVNDVPVISDAGDLATDEDTATGAIAFTVSDPDHAAGTLTVTATSANPTLIPAGGIVLGGSGASRTVTLTPATNQNGTAAITLTVSDGTDSAADSFTLTVNAVNDAPTINHIADRAIDEDASTGAMAFTIGDVDNNAADLIVSAASSNPSLVPQANLVLGGSGASRSLTATPIANRNGTATIAVTVSDGTNDGSDSFVLTVNAVNDVPQAFDDGAETNEDTLVVVDVLANDVDADSALDPASVAIRSESRGVATVNRETGAVGFLPDPNFFGEAGFTYTVADVEGAASNVATVAVFVNSVNDAPVAEALSVGTDEETPVTGQLAASDVDGDALSFAKTAGPTNGTVTVNTDGSFTYQPNLNFAGSDSFTFTASDGAVSSAPATVTVNVADLPEPGLTISGASLNERDAGAETLNFVVRLSRAPDGPVTVSYATADLTARAGSDYTAASGTLRFEGGDTLEQTIRVPVINDTFQENEETLQVALTVMDGAGSAKVVSAAAIGTISDDDDKGLLRAGAAKRSVTPCDQRIAGVCENHIGGVNETRLGGAPKKQKFNLGGFGVNPLQNFPDPFGTAGESLTEPASRRVFNGTRGEEHTWVRAMVIEEPSSTGGPPEQVAFVVLDAVGAGNVIQEGLRTAVNAATGIPKNNILFGQTHTHAGADLQGLWGGVPQDWISNILYKQAAAAVKEALDNLRPANLRMAQGQNLAFNNYRNPPLDPNAEADGTMTLVTATADSGETIGQILQYNAHPTGIGNGVKPRTPHADFILGAVDWLENPATGDGGVALYFNGAIADASGSGSRPGCSAGSDGSFGDVRCKGEGMAEAAQVFAPRPLGATLDVRHAEVTLPVTNPLFVAAGALGAFNRYYDFAGLPTSQLKQIPFLGPLIEAQVINLPQVTPTARTLVSRVTLGGAAGGLEIVTIPGEATNTFGQYIRGLTPNKNMMLLGLTQNSFGYILPEEEFSYINESNPEGKYLALAPFTNYEEMVSLGPLTAPLLRLNGYNPLFGIAQNDTRNLPPWLAACQDPMSDACIVNYIGKRLDFFQRAYAAQCRKYVVANAPAAQKPQAETFCALLDPETPLEQMCRDSGFAEGTCSVFGVAASGAENTDQALLFAALEATARGCDLLDPAHCLFPFPSDHFTANAPAGSPQSKEKGGSGKRINFNPLAMPRNAAGKPIDPTEWNRNDGFSPGQMIVTYVPGLATEPDGRIKGAVPITDLSQYDDPDAPILVVDTETGERHPVWAEIDLTASTLLRVPGDEFGQPDTVVPRTGVVRAPLIIRAGVNFKEGHRYVVVLRKLQRQGGGTVAAQTPFRACRDKVASQLPQVQGRCAKLEADVFPVLANAGIVRDASLYLAWDFTVASANNNIGRLRHMRDDAFVSYLGQEENADGSIRALGRAPHFEITEINENPNAEQVREIKGTFTVPSYVVPADPSPADGQAGLRNLINQLPAQLQAQIEGGPLFAPIEVSSPPNRLFYDPSDAPNPSDPQGSLFGDGLPDRSGELTTTFTCRIAKTTLSGKPFASATEADLKPARPSLYGHGLLGDHGEINQEQLRRFSKEHNMMFCATDWFGFASGDLPNVLSMTVDMSNFPTVPDGTQQGMLNQLFLARLLRHPQGFASHEAFRVGGQPVFDNREVYYDGNSQGGINGGVVIAASKDINRGSLGVLGMNYSTLLTRSVDFDIFSVPIYLSYPDELDRNALFSLIQMLWDRSENNGYAHHITDNSAFKGPDNEVLLHPAFGDHQVTMWSADVMARTVGARVDRSRVSAERHPDTVEFFGIETLDYANTDHAAGSSLMYWDEPWDDQIGNDCFGFSTPPPPIGNVPPRAGQDPHECPRRQVAARCQKSHFLHSAGRLIDVGGVGNDAANCPALPPAVAAGNPEGAPTPNNGTGLVAVIADFMQAAGDFVQAALENDLGAALAAIQDALASLARNLLDLLVGDDGSLLAALDRLAQNLQEGDAMGLFTDFLSDAGAIIGLQRDPVSAAQAAGTANREVEAVVITGATVAAWSQPAAAGVAHPYPSGAATTGAALNPAGIGTIRNAHNGRMLHPANWTPGQAPQNFGGVPVNEIGAYAFVNGAWTEIPVQVDERYPYFLANANSSFSTYSGTDPELSYAWDAESWAMTQGECAKQYDTNGMDDGRNQGLPGPTPDPIAGLDNDDEIVFMAKDSGERAPAGSLPSDVPTGAAGQEIALLDPLLNPESGQPSPPRFVYLFRKPGGSSFRGQTVYVDYVRDANADQWIDRSFFAPNQPDASGKDPDPERIGTSNTGYGPNLAGTVCSDGTPATAKASTDRFPRDGVTVSTDAYQWRASGRWMVRNVHVARSGAPRDYGPDLVDRWKGRAFQQSPDSTISAVGFEDEQVNWEANSTLLGERVGPVRAIREVWGADSGTNVTKIETFYRDAVAYRYHIRVHPIPPDGLYTSWDYNRAAMVPTAGETAAGVEGGRYFTQLRPQGVPVDGINDDAGSIDSIAPVMTPSGPKCFSVDDRGLIDPDANGQCPAFFDAADPTFNLMSGFYNWEQVSGKGDNGSLVYLFEIKGETSAANPLVVPYYRDDACLDDGTGDDPVPRPFPGESYRWNGGHVPRAYDAMAGRPLDHSGATFGDCVQRQGAHGAHGVHYFFTHDSDNALSPATSTEVDGQQWQFMVPTDRPQNIGEPYANVVRAPLKAVAFPRSSTPGAARELFRNYPSLLACVQSQNSAACQQALAEILTPDQVTACQPKITNPECVIGPAFSAALMALDDTNQRMPENSQPINPGSTGNGIYNVYIPSASGEIIAFTVFEPAAIVSGQVPLVLHGHGYGGSRTRTRGGIIQSLNNAGYAVISFDQRGFGESSGTVRVLDPDVEGQDLVRLVDWAETNLPWLAYRDGNLVLGSIGGSYGGGYQFLLNNVDPKRRLDALVPDIAWNDLRSSLAPAGVVKSGWGLLLPVGGEAGSQGQQDPFVKETLLMGIATNRFPEDSLAWFNYHSNNYFCESAGENSSQRIDVYGRLGNFPGAGAARREPPPVDVLLTQGFRDTLFNFNQAYANYRCLSQRGGDVRLSTHQGGHILPSPVSPATSGSSCGGKNATQITLAWFAEKLKGQAGAADSIPEICLSLADGDSVIDQTAVTVGGTAFKVPLTRNIPNGFAALPNAGAGPIVIELGLVTAANTVLAGIPTAHLTVSHPVFDHAQADPVIFVGLGVLKSGQSDWTLIDDQVQPVRGLGNKEFQLVGVAERLAAGDKLALLVSGFHPQYPESWSRDVTTPAVHIQGTVHLPILSGTMVALPSAESLQQLCASYGVPQTNPLCDVLGEAQAQLSGGCEDATRQSAVCEITDGDLAGGNLRGLLETCYLNNPGESELPVCRVADALVGGATAWCRQVSTASGGAQPPEFCVLMGGVLVSEGALQTYEQSWTHQALLLQNRLGYSLPLVHNSVVATHNSFNASDDNTPPTLSGSDYNQLYDIVGQLRMDVRAIEIDVHWAPGRDGTPETFFREPMVCHGLDGSQMNGGCTTEKPLREVLRELRTWLDAHPEEAIVLYIEDDITGTQPADQRPLAYAKTAQVIADELGDIVFGPGHHGSSCSNSGAADDAASWLNVSRRQILAAGKQLLLYTETCAGGAWNALFHQKNSNIVQGTQPSYATLTYSPGADNCVFAANRRTKWTRVWEDSTVVSATGGSIEQKSPGDTPGIGEPGARLDPSVAHELMRCGLNMPSLDRLYPADGRLEGMVWSWAQNEPAANDALDCAAHNADGRFFAAECAQPRAYACVSDTNPDQWTVAGSGEWIAGAGACPAGFHFGVPGNGYANEKLKEAKTVAGAGEVWLNYSDAAVEGVWEGDAVGGAAPRANAVFRAERGLKNALGDFLGGIADAAGAFLSAEFERFASAIAAALEALARDLYAVVVGNEESSLTALINRLLTNLRELDAANLARDLARDLGRLAGGSTGTTYPTGTVRAGVGVVDMTPDVGYGSGQYAAKSPDTPNGEIDPYATHKMQKKSYGVQSRLTGRALVVEGANGKRIALVKSDNYLAQDMLMRRVGQILEEKGSSIGYPQILHHVTHAHSTSYSSTLSWGVWAFQDAYDARFFENQARKLAEAILIAEADLKPARMGATTIRHKIFKGNIMGLKSADDGTPAGYPNEYGDHGLVVMRLDDMTDPQSPQPLAVWVNWGEHPEGLDPYNLHSADYLASLERFVERDLGAPLVFSQGDVGSAEKSGNAAQRLRDDGSVCNDEPGETCPDGQGLWRDWNHKGYVQNERNVRYLADDIVKAWRVIGGEREPDATVPTVQVALSSVFPVDYRNAWVPGPVSHPYPSVSNCRSESTVEGNPGSPIIGLPDCERATSSNARTLLIWETLKAHGLPVPDHYDAPGFTGVEENLRLYLQAFRLGEVLLASCACEAQVDLILNLESRADDRAGNIYDGFDWACVAEDKGQLPTDPAYAAACARQRDHYFDVNEFPTGVPGSNFTAGAIAHLRAQVHNDARGWDLPENAVAANSEPADLTKIWGNFTQEEIQDLGADGYALAVGIGHAGDYNGYTVSYREYMGYDHYRKALTSYGPHTADYMVTRLVRMAAAMKGAPEPAPEPHDAMALADEARQASLAVIAGNSTASAFDTYYTALPDDISPAQIVTAATDITRFAAATLTWRGGSTAVDNPLARVQREMAPGLWMDAYDMTGEVQTRVDWPDGLPETAEAHAGQFEWLWTAYFEAYTAFPARLGSTAEGSYRFVVDGRVKDSGALVSYHLASAPFRVLPWNGISVTNASRGITSVGFTVPPIVYPRPSAPAGFPLADDEGDTNYCTQCTFRPWASVGRFERAEVIISRQTGGTDIVPASCTTSGGTTACSAYVLLLPTDTVAVRAYDQDGNFGEASVP